MTQPTVRIPYDSLTLRAVAAELRDRLIDGHLQEIRQPNYTDVYLAIRAQGKNWTLCLSNDARFARVHLTQKKPANLPTPMAFCQVLRKHLIGGRINAIRQIAFDRILEIEINALDEAGEKTQLRLIAEMMGKHSNLVLVNADGLILDAARRISHRVNRFRETQPGLPYIPPPIQQDRIDPFAPNVLAALFAELPNEISPKQLANHLMETYAGMSPFLAQELTERGRGGEREKGREEKETIENSKSKIENLDGWQENLRAAWEDIFGSARHNEYNPTAISAHHHVSGAYPFPVVQVPATQQKPAETLNDALDLAFATARAQAEFEAAAGDLRARIDRALRRMERQRESLERSQSETANAEAFKQQGELILANAWQIPAGADRVTVQDYFDPQLPNRTIPLDPQLSPQENAEAFFRRYRRAKSGEMPVQEQAELFEQQSRILSNAQAKLARWEETRQQTAEDIRAWRDELMQTNVLRADDETDDDLNLPDFEGHRIKRYLTPDGYVILIGENATANDYLTHRVAAPNDIWLHVRADTSAHVVIRTNGKPDLVPRPVLLRAASLCALNSSQKHAAMVSVDWTLKKFVRKPRGAAPGSANYERERTLDIAPREEGQTGR